MGEGNSSNGNFELEMEQIRAAYDKRNENEVAWNAYRDLMYKTVERLIYFLAKRWSGKSYGNQLATFHDLVQEAVVALMEGLDQYDPYISTPSTYFLPRFEAQMKKTLNNFPLKVSDYYRESIAVTDTVLKENGYANGINDPAVTIGLIVDVMNIPVKTAKMVYEMAQREYTNLEDPGYLENKTDISTEERAIRNQEVTALIEDCDKLTPLEKFIFDNVLYEHVSYRTLVTLLKQNSALLKEFSLDRRQVTGKFIKQIESRALRKLRRSISKPNTVKIAQEVYVQASDDDVDDFFHDDHNDVMYL